MPCPRCGGKSARPTPPPSVISRPGTVPTPAQSAPRPSNPSVRDAITGLRYVPSK